MESKNRIVRHHYDHGEISYYIDNYGWSYASSKNGPLHVIKTAPPSIAQKIKWWVVGGVFKRLIENETKKD